MDASQTPRHGQWIPDYNPFGDDGIALPDTNAKLADYGTTFKPLPEDAGPIIKRGHEVAPDDFKIHLKRDKQPAWLHWRRSKVVGTVAGLSLSTCAIPLGYYYWSQPSAPTTAMSTNHGASAATDAERTAYLAALAPAFEQVRDGKRRGTVVIDLGHGSYMGEDAHGVLKQTHDPGAQTHTKRGRDVITINEADITEAMGARIGLRMVQQGFAVRFTRKVDLQNNPHLADLSPLERDVVAHFNTDRTVLKNRFDQRIETARTAQKEDGHALYLVLHADKAVNTARRGAGVFLHPSSPTDGAAYRLAQSLQTHYRDDARGNLGPNVTKGVIPGQEGFGALFKKDCTPEIGLGTRKVAIITPKPSGKGYAQVRNGLGDIPYALVEMGYLSNAADTWRLRDQTWGNNFARVTAEGVNSFFAKEYEGAKPPPKPATITVNGKQARIVPTNANAAEQMLNGMASALSEEKARTTSITTRVIQRCEPSGDRYSIRIAEYGPITPKAPVTGRVKPTIEKIKADGPRKPIEHATRDEPPRTR